MVFTIKSLRRVVETELEVTALHGLFVVVGKPDFHRIRGPETFVVEVDDQQELIAFIAHVNNDAMAGVRLCEKIMLDS